MPKDSSLEDEVEEQASPLREDRQTLLLLPRWWPRSRRCWLDEPPVEEVRKRLRGAIGRRVGGVGADIACDEKRCSETRVTADLSLRFTRRAL